MLTHLKKSDKRNLALQILRKYENRPIGYDEWEITNAMLEFAEKCNPLSLVEVDRETFKICQEAYNNGEKITAIKTLIEEVDRKGYKFGIKEAKGWLEKGKNISNEKDCVKIDKIVDDTCL